MGRFSRDEVDAAFRDFFYTGCVAEDWSAWARKFTDDCRYVERRLGRHRLAGTFAFRTLLTAGARLALGSDWPIVSCDPLAGMRAAITGELTDGRCFAPEQNLTIEEALRGYTIGAADCLGLHAGGRLVPGAPGDLVLFDRDPFAADWAASPPRCILTVAGGRVVFDGR